MPRSYRDQAELRTEPVDSTVHPLVTPGSVILLGIGFPAVEEPVPIMLTPGYEYRLRQIQNDGEPVWALERRAV